MFEQNADFHRAQVQAHQERIRQQAGAARLRSEARRLRRRRP
ncbi:MAG: hypothetical protein WAS51_07750 [Ilumatobacteraceae bacterium]